MHLTHPGIWGIFVLRQYAFWPYMHHKIFKKTATCKPCTDINKTLRTVIPKSQWKPPEDCLVPKENEIQTDFEGPMIRENNQDMHFLEYIYGVSKYATV